MVLSRRKFSLALLTAAAAVPLLNFSSCNQSGALKALRNILAKWELSFKDIVGMVLSADIIQQVSKYLTSVTQFVAGASRILEDNLLSAAEKAAKITALGVNVVLPHFSDPRVQASLLAVQKAVALFLSLFQAPNPTEVHLDAHNRDALHEIEAEAQKDQADAMKWAASPHPTPAGAVK
jgi:hypothetical protein